MAGLILTPNGSYKIPECEKCNSRMLPMDLERIEKDIWKCPHCMNEQKEK